MLGAGCSSHFATVDPGIGHPGEWDGLSIR